MAEARDAGDFVFVASLAAAAAFDTVRHELLLVKLEAMCGVSGAPLRLLRRSFTARRQRVCLSGDRRSPWRHVPSGVAQGAVISPLLYALFSSDLPAAVTCARIIQFADDVNLVARGATVQ